MRVTGNKQFFKVGLDNEEQKFITLRWVLSEKGINGKLNVKSRLAVRGFQEDNKHVLCHLPTCNKTSMCLILNSIASLKWPGWSTDIKAIAHIQHHNCLKISTYSFFLSFF